MIYGRLAVSLALALVLTGCCCAEPAADLRGPARANGPERLFVVVRATPLDATEEGKRQVLIESSVVSVRGTGPIDALDQAQRLDLQAAPVWLAGTQAPDATFGDGSRVETKPSIVTREEEEATIQVAESSGDGGTASMVDIHAAPTFDAQGALTVALRFQQYERGALTHAVPQVSLTGPAGRVFILEALPVR